MNLQAIETRITELDDALELSYPEIYQTVCNEFGIDGQTIADELGCEDPFALLGYLQYAE